MISGFEQLQQALNLYAQAREQLTERNIPFDRSIQVGIMVEIPSAVMVLPVLLPLIDFVSIGTNDLTQYTLAVDRGDAEVTHLYDETHPAVLRLIYNTIDLCRRAKKGISVCGEMAGDAKLTRLLLGFGLREFSMQPAQVLSVKERILKASSKKSRKAAEDVLLQYEHVKIRQRIKDMNKKVH